MSAQLTAWIETARRATGARKVRLHSIPAWARSALRVRYRDEPRRAFGGCVKLAMINDERWCGLFDHWGTSELPEGVGCERKTLCTEPYGGRAEIEAALRFADWIDCDVEIGGASWWYPGSTVRIEFRQREGSPS